MSSGVLCSDSGLKEEGGDGIHQSEQGNGGLVQQPEREQLGEEDREPGLRGEAALPPGRVEAGNAARG